ncbi:3-oxoadipate enol-lactonase [Aquincola sp. S2]|uniref:3-oxoadipate enol-lactonase n=1 Tax=Pseudaquabacterium terrae TaxID=2732868 RepID=A0ABX2ERM6_9BURK|nr:3-oxoadipate enol-lactonase [Aquabacterium terrae]NRF71171.1 3-oxoadipate enol-lactonase [Aquabacterium terrae]
MPQLHFVTQGQGPLVVLSHALGCDLTMWDGVAAQLQPHFTVLRYDHRGHGRSPAGSDAFTVADLADDAAELIRAHGGGAAHFVGLSMGGMTAQALGARHPALVRSLVIANSASHYDEAALALWRMRIATVQAQGMEAIADGALQRWFTPEFRADSRGGQARVAALRAVLVATAPAPYAAACAAVAGIDLEAGNATIGCPTLVIAGDRDDATPPALSRAIADSIPRARLQSLDAAHLSAVEQPEAFAQLLSRFWDSLPAVR